MINRGEQGRKDIDNARIKTESKLVGKKRLKSDNLEGEGNTQGSNQKTARHSSNDELLSTVPSLAAIIPN